jgi:hypothetical protein
MRRSGEFCVKNILQAVNAASILKLLSFKYQEVKTKLFGSSVVYWHSGLNT